MTITANYIKHIEREIIEISLNALEKNELTEEDLKNIAETVLETSGKIALHDELLTMLEGLAVNWPIFSNTLILEKGKKLEEHKGAVIDSVLGLAKSGQIQEAIAVAKSFTNTNAL